MIKDKQVDSMVNIIVIDNRPYIRYRVKDLIEKPDTSVYGAANSTQLFNVLRELNNEVSLIIIDINLREEDGIEVIKKLRKRNINVPFMVLTSINTRDAFIRSVKAGAVDYFLKPFDDNLFAKRVLRHANGNHSIEDENITEEETDFIKYLNNEIGEASHKKQQISFIMFIVFRTNEDLNLDINHDDEAFFKFVYEKIKELSQGSDMFVKHGANTFLGVYTNCDKEKIEVISEDINKNFEENKELENKKEENEKSKSISVNDFYFDSVYATFPENGDSVEMLINNLEWKLNEKILGMQKESLKKIPS